MRVVWTWESSIEGRRLKQALTLLTRDWKESSQNSGGPMGHPRREKPTLVVGMVGGSGLTLLSFLSFADSNVRGGS